MGFVGNLAKGALKLAGSAALTATGVTATFVRQVGCLSGVDVLENVAGTIQDKSFEKIRDMWTPEDKKDDAYYDAQAERAMRRAESAQKKAEQFRENYEREKEKYTK